MISINPKDFFQLTLCDPCKRLFLDHDTIQAGPSFQQEFFHRSGHYDSVVLRSDIENAYRIGCEFCSRILPYDRNYSKEKHNGWKELHFHPRPSWYPDLLEPVTLHFHYDRSSSALELSCRTGLLLKHQGPGTGIRWWLHTTADDPATRLGIRPLSPKVMNITENLLVIKDYLHECIHSHGDCLNKPDAQLPTRLIELSAKGEPESAHLRITQGQTGSYVTLSYCWGGPQPLATIASRFSTYMQALPYEKLPKTILDAFQVVRDLGLKYIWIDSFCIIQDDMKDVQMEISRMLEVYENAQLTISAACAFNAAEGFLDNRFCQAKGPFFVPVRVDNQTIGSMLVARHSKLDFAGHSQPINERAWTLQESLISPRLLIFSGLDMLWKCDTMFKSGTNDDIRDDQLSWMVWTAWAERTGFLPYSMKDLANITRAQENMPDSEGEKAEEEEEEEEDDDDDDDDDGGLLEMWHTIVENYTKRKLTNRNDKLPAISAIARKFASYFNCDYLAGMWRDRLIHEIAWYTRVPTIQTGPRQSPSWSWISVDSAIIPSDPMAECLPAAEVLHCYVKLTSVGAPFGTITSGELMINGFLKEIELDLLNGKIMVADAPHLNTTDLGLPSKLLSEGQGEEAGSDNVRSFPNIRQHPAIQLFQQRLYELYLDVLDDFSKAYPKQKQCIKAWYLPLRYRDYGFYGFYHADGMILVRHDSYPQTYQRVGYLVVRERPPFWWEQGGKSEIKII